MISPSSSLALASFEASGFNASARLSQAGWGVGSFLAKNSAELSIHTADGQVGVMGSMPRVNTAFEKIEMMARAGDKVF